MKCQKALFFFFFLYIGQGLYGQNWHEVGGDINSNKGTFVVRKIAKTTSTRNNNSLLIVRIFRPFCNLLKPQINPIKLLLVDSTEYSIDKAGFIKMEVSKGRHIVSIKYPENPPFSSFTPKVVKFKARREYQIDIYLTTPFSESYH